MYDIHEKFLYEVLDEYRSFDDVQLKENVFKMFCKTLWSVNNARQVYQRVVSYKVDSKLTGEVANVFRKYERVPYNTYKSSTKIQNSWYLLRQKINNIYTNICDDSVCKKNDYLNCIYYPKRMYFRYIQGELNIDPDVLNNRIEENIQKSVSLFNIYAKQKIHISWLEYKKLIEKYLHRIFDNYIPLDEFEDKNKMIININHWTEDNYVIKYIGSSLSGYMKNYQKEYYGIKEHKKYFRCECGNLVNYTCKHDYSTKYCSDCRQAKRKEINRNYYMKKKLR